VSKSLDLLNLLNASHAPGKNVAWRDGKVIRWHAFLIRVHAWSSLLQNTPASRFALYSSDSIEFACALFGAWQAGKTVYLPADALPATCAILRSAVDGYLGEFPHEFAPLVLGSQNNDAAPGDFKYLNPDFVGLIVYTSGSSGAAQAIPKKLSQLAAEVSTLETMFGNMLGEADVIATVSHQHIYGLLFKVLWPLSAGRVIHARSFAFLEETTSALAANDCVLVSSPAHLKRLPEMPALAVASERLRAVFSSGGPLSLDAAQSTERLLNKTPIEVYGSSETGGIAWRQQFGPSDESWAPMPGVAWRIVSDNNALQVCSGHLPDLSWFEMADRAQPTDDNRFVLQGRLDRIVKVEEKRISLDAIERQLAESPLVAEVRVLAHEARRHRIAAFIVPSAQGRHVLAEDGKLAVNRLLRDTLIHSVERVALPRSWRYLDALPVNAQGKTTHAELLALLDDSVVRPTLPRHRLVEKDELRAVFELTAPHDLLYFDGHFSGAPILAGVVQVDWVIAFGRQCFDLPPHFRAIHALKFQHVIRPEMQVTLELIHDVAKASLAFRFSSASVQHASGRIIFGSSDV
jgi:acyl-coenzyme A synthetase/AMP-(fatty) acid ligase/3-hydroxymyristoyl/3-hydroxydecanoyl-(acyl carrier protein) dehydratase